jgi:hypothetical protein
MMFGWPELESVLFYPSAVAFGLRWKDEGFDSPDEKLSDDEDDEGLDEDASAEEKEWEAQRQEYLKQYREERRALKPIHTAWRAKIRNAPPNACPHLRSFVLRECLLLGAAHVHALKVMAPNLQEFHADVHVGSDVPRTVFREALIQWAPTLRSLGLEPTTVGKPVTIDSDLAQKLSVLRTLKGNVCLVDVDSLRHLTALERLKFSVDTMADVAQLVKVIPELPILRDFELWSMQSDRERPAVSKQGVEPLAKLCQSRKIAFKSRVHVIF